MTACARAVLPTSFGRLSIQISSLNRKFLEVSVTLPRELAQFETAVRKAVTASIQRGAVVISISAHFDAVSPMVFTANLPLVRQLKAACEAIAQELQLSPSAVALEMLGKERDLLVCSADSLEVESYSDELQAALEQVLATLIAMKEREGKQLEADIAHRLTILHTRMREIKESAPQLLQKNREKLQESVRNAMGEDADCGGERLLRDLCLLAEKGDIAEEVTRFFSHLQQFEEVMGFPQLDKGKTLEFLVQELGREVHTVHSKLPDITITPKVIEIKRELERIREQLQNVE